MIVQPLQLDHLRAMRLQPHQEYLRSFMTDEYMQTLLGSEVARVMFIGGEIVSCFGIARAPAVGRLLWCFLADTARHHLLRVHRYAVGFAAEHAAESLFSTVEVGFEPGVRLLELVGFREVASLAHYGPDGQDHLLFKFGGRSCQAS